MKRQVDTAISAFCGEKCDSKFTRQKDFDKEVIEQRDFTKTKASVNQLNAVKDVLDGKPSGGDLKVVQADLKAVGRQLIWNNRLLYLILAALVGGGLTSWFGYAGVAAELKQHIAVREAEVVGWKTDEFPAFYSRRSGLPVDVRVESATGIAEIVRMQRELKLRQSVLVAAPVPVDDEVPAEDVEPLIEQAIAEAAGAGVTGKALTPYILARLVILSAGRTLHANQSLLIHNAQVAAQIAVAVAGIS